MRKTLSIPFIKGFNFSPILKKHLLIFVLMLFGLGVMAKPHLATKKQIEMFLNSKTCVVLGSGSMLYNVYIKNAVEKYWKSTAFEFIDKQEFDKRRYNSKYSFIVLTKVVFNKDKSGIKYNYINLVLGDTAVNITDMPELCSIPLSYSGESDIKYGYVIPSIIKFMQKHVNTLANKRFMISIKGLKYYNGRISMNHKELLLNKEMMAEEANSPEKIKTVYKYPVKLLTTIEIESELANNNANGFFNFYVGPGEDSDAGKCFVMVLDLEGNLYYYNSREISAQIKDGFNLKDFSHIW